VAQIKKLSNNDFFNEWKLIHKKGIIVYQMRNTIPFILFMIFINIFYRMKFPFNTEAFIISVKGSAILILIIIVSRLLRWFHSEKRYKYIEKISEGNTQKN